MWPYNETELAFINCGAGINKKGKTKMNYFNIDTVTAEYAKNAKTVLGFVPNAEAKSLLEKVVDLQVETVKLAATSVESMTKSMGEYAKKAAAFGK